MLPALRVVAERVGFVPVARGGRAGVIEEAAVDKEEENVFRTSLLRFFIPLGRWRFLKATFLKVTFAAPVGLGARSFLISVASARVDGVGVVHGCCSCDMLWFVKDAVGGRMWCYCPENVCGGV